MSFETVTARLPNGKSFPFAVHATGDLHVSAAIRDTGRWEPFATRILWSLLRPGDGVLDIGANIGWYASVLGRAVGNGGYVHSFEPDPANAALLRKNVDHSELSHVTVHLGALADRQGTMHLALSEANLGDHRLVSDDAQHNRRSVEVPVNRLDDVIVSEHIDLERLRVVKIDTQGAEVMILNGAQNLLANLHPRTAILVEYAPNLLAAHGPDAVEQFISLVTGVGRDIYTLRRASTVPTDATRLRRLAANLAPHGDEWAVDLLVVPVGLRDRMGLTRFRAPRPTRWV